MIIKTNETMAKTRFIDPSAKMAMMNVLLVLSGSSIDTSWCWNSCAASAALEHAAGNILGLLSWVVNVFFMVDEDTAASGKAARQVQCQW